MPIFQPRTLFSLSCQELQLVYMQTNLRKIFALPSRLALPVTEEIIDKLLHVRYLYRRKATSRQDRDLKEVENCTKILKLFTRDNPAVYRRYVSNRGHFHSGSKKRIDSDLKMLYLYMFDTEKSLGFTLSRHSISYTSFIYRYFFVVVARQ